MPASLAGDQSARGREFAAIAQKVKERAEQVAAQSEDVLEIS
jgi:hypothetical protein